MKQNRTGDGSKIGQGTVLCQKLNNIPLYTNRAIVNLVVSDCPVILFFCHFSIWLLLNPVILLKCLIETHSECRTVHVVSSHTINESKTSSDSTDKSRLVPTNTIGKQTYNIIPSYLPDHHICKANTSFIICHRQTSYRYRRYIISIRGQTPD